MRRTDTFYYVPLLDNLRALLSLDEIASEVLNPHPSEHGELRDFCDGSVFKSHPLFSTCPHALQIIGYYDELEVVNPIGSYVSKHKLGCLFFFLGNIRPQYRSTLSQENPNYSFLLPFAQYNLQCPGYYLPVLQRKWVYPHSSSTCRIWNKIISYSAIRRDPHRGGWVVGRAGGR